MLFPTRRARKAARRRPAEAGAAAISKKVGRDGTDDADADADAVRTDRRECRNSYVDRTNFIRTEGNA